MNKHLACFVLSLCLAGCWQNVPEPTVDGSRTVQNSIEFAGRRWAGAVAVRMGELKGVSVVGFYEAMVYPGETNERLVVLDSKPYSDGKQSNSWQQIHVMQTEIGEKWINHGLKQTVYKDGIRIDQTYVLGKKEGMEVVFYADGKLHRQTEYKGDKRNGRGVAYWEDGSLQFVANYANDVEISGESWNKGEATEESTK